MTRRASLCALARVGCGGEPGTALLHGHSVSARGAEIDTEGLVFVKAGGGLSKGEAGVAAGASGHKCACKCMAAPWPVRAGVGSRGKARVAA